jgi:hypothetical protein
VLAFGFMYFGTIGLYEMFSYRWNPRSSRLGQQAV